MTELLVIDGARVAAAEGRTFETVNPATGEVFRTVAEAGSEDADRAVRAAARAFEVWGSRTAVQRAKVLYRWADLIEEHVDELGLLETRDMGMALGDARWCAGNAAAVMRYYAGAVDKLFGSTIPVDRDGIVLTFREPIGVVGSDHAVELPAEHRQLEDRAGDRRRKHRACSSPPPSHRSALSDTPSWASRPGSPPASSTSFPVRDAPSATHSSSTRSSARSASPARPRSGIEIARKAAGTIKRVTLELGGKSACVVFADADLEKAGPAGSFSVFENAGQDCCARSRLLVEESVKDELLEHYRATTRAIVVGNPEADGTQMGPLVSAGQRETVEGYIERGRSEGATVVEGGTRPDDPALAEGYYLRPTILDDCTNEMTVSREEIFGPVVSVITFRDEAEAIRLANDTPYGLSGSLWTRDGARQLRVARALRTGGIGVNSNSSVFPQAPFGGYKQSGVGKELGMEGLVHNTELKSVFISTEPS